MMKASVYSWGAAIWVSSTRFQKSNIAWPQQPPAEKLPNISEKLDFWWSIPQKGTSIGHFGARDDHTIMIRNFLEEIGLMRLVRPMRLPRLLRSMRLQMFLGPWKSLLRTSVIQVLEFYDLRKNVDVLKKIFLTESWKSRWILATFLSEAGEASLCHFFENWLMKLKWPHLRNTQMPLS
jgi:hypothetical protein